LRNTQVWKRLEGQLPIGKVDYLPCVENPPKSIVIGSKRKKK
jgi:hypothetical protein